MKSIANLSSLSGLAKGALDAQLQQLQGLTLAQAWAKLAPLPFGKQAFAQLVKLRIPYTGTIGAVVQELSDGHSVVVMRDRRAVRNHLDCVHALALANLGEFSSGLAMFHAVEGKAKGIVTGLQIEYHKKARGTLTATCDVDIPAIDQPSTTVVQALIREQAGDVVCTVKASWSLKPL